MRFSLSTSCKSHHQRLFAFFSPIQTVNMATSTSKATCTLCDRTKELFLCQACSNHFCYDHMPEHRRNIQQQFDHLRNDHDQLRQQINDLKIDSTKYALMKEIDRWEEESINKIKQHAQLCRMQSLRHSNILLLKMEHEFNNLAAQIREIHRENQFNETDLNDLRVRFTKLEQELNQPPNISIKQQSTPLINKISLLPAGTNSTGILLINEIRLCEKCSK